MEGRGKWWSLEVGEKESRLRKEKADRSYDDQLTDVLKRFHLDNVQVLVGDSRSIELETGDVDLVFVDGDHSYEGVKSDFERFGRRVRIGGAGLFDDAFYEEIFKTHVATGGRAGEEACQDNQVR